MSSTLELHTPARTPPQDDALTLAAISTLAFIVADLAHEVIGHGLGFLATGGRSGILTTTRLITQDPLSPGGWRIFDLGGPAGNIVFAFIGIFGLRFLSRRSVHLRLFFWLLAAFSLFWAFGYLMFSGVFARGDWVALVGDFVPATLWRLSFFISGLLLYEASLKLLATELPRVVDPSAPGAIARVRRIVRYSYLFGGVIACAGAILDPRGRMEMLNSGALTSFAAAIGLLRMPRLFSPSAPSELVSPPVLSRSRAWIAFAMVIALLYILVLGHGIHFRL